MSGEIYDHAVDSRHGSENGRFVHRCYSSGTELGINGTVYLGIIYSIYNGGYSYKRIDRNIARELRMSSLER